MLWETQSLISESWARIWKRFRSPGIDSKESVPRAYVAWRADMTNGVFIPVRQATLAGRIDSLELIPGLIQRLKIRALIT